MFALEYQLEGDKNIKRYKKMSKFEKSHSYFYFQIFSTNRKNTIFIQF